MQIENRRPQSTKQVPRGLSHIGFISGPLVREIGLRAIQWNLVRGRYHDADGIRRQLGVSWSDIIDTTKAVA